ncbi:MAG: hypothetical protein GX957_02155 [Clostridiaceae bacterium]|nr:hypothetical protein [Clostridiaceae bacterium]
MFRRLPLISGPMAYILGVLTAVLGLKKYRLKMKFNDSSEILEKDFLLSIFANGAFYGGGMKPVPKAKIDDGIMDFCLVEPVSRLKLLKFFPVYKKGEHGDMEEVFITTGKKVFVESEQPFPLNIDGEVFTETKAEIEIFPDFLNVIIPVEF